MTFYRAVIPAAVMFLSLAVGCGGGGGGDSTAESSTAAAHDPAAVVEVWTGKIDDWARVSSVNGPPQVNPKPAPPPPNELILHQASPTGVEIGHQADLASPLIAVGTDLDARSMKEILCTWYAWYVEGGTPVPAKGEFEALFTDYIADRLNSGKPTAQQKEAIGQVRASIASAQSAEPTAADTAVATVCTLPRI